MEMPNFTKATMHNHRLVVFFILLLVGAGIFSLWKMPKQEFPEFKMAVGMVVAVYPGASAEEVEQQLTNRLEDYIFSFNEVNAEETTSSSSDGYCSMMVMLNDEGAKDPNAVWGKIRDGLPLLQKTVLPLGVLGVAVLDNFGEAAAELIVLDSDDKSYRELGDYASDLKRDLLGVKNITNLRIQGVLPEQISIYLDKERMVRFGVNNSMINALLTMQGVTTGGAHIESGDTDMPIYVSSSYTTEQELGDQIILNDPSGKLVRLKDVARVVREYPEVKSFITNNGRRAVLVGMEMKRGGDIVAFGQEVDRQVDAFKQSLPEGVNVTRIANQPQVVRDSIIGFFGDFLEAIVIVVLVMMLLFPIRSAVVAGFSIPITIMITFALMNAFNIPLSNVTLAALMVALGMVVDDSIIIIDAHQDLLRQHKSSWFASVMSAHNFFPSISVATLSICFVFLPTPVFLPTFLATFFKVFIFTLILSLLTSLLVAMLVVPLLNHKFLGKSSFAESKLKESRFLAPIQRGYEWALDRCFRHPWLTIVACVAIVVGGVLLFKQLPQRMIPNADRDQFVVEIYNPKGSGIDHTAAITDSVARVMQADDRVVDVTQFVGQLMPRFMVSAPIAMGGKSFSQIVIRTKGNTETLSLIRDYTGYFEERWPDTFVRMFQLSYCMASTDIALMLEGEDLRELHAAADTIKQYMRSQDGLLWIHDAFGEKQPIVRVDLDPISAAQLGVTRLSVASSLAMKYGGFKAGSIWDDDYEMPVMLYTADREEQKDLTDLGNDYVGTALGGNVPLRQITHIRPDWCESNIMHAQGKRCVNVQADVRPGFSKAKTSQAINRYVKEQVIPGLHGNVKYKKWGAELLNSRIGEPLVKSFLISLSVILLVMVLNFKRFRLSLLAMAGTLLALPGAALGQWLSGNDFSMTSMLGLFSLLGIVMRNSVIMFDYAEELKAKGMAVREAAIEAGHRRMIPIFLTSATTAVGVIPVMFSESTLWPSMGWVISFGTLTATLLVVTVMPCAYWKLMEKKSKK